MATSTTTGAVYGVGIYGQSLYGVVNVSVVPDGVQASCTTDSGVIIEADATHVVIGVTSTGATGQVGTAAAAAIEITGTEAFGEVGDALEFILYHTEELANTEATGSVGTVTAKINIVANPASVQSNSFVNTVSITGDSLHVPTGVVGTSNFGTVSFKLGHTQNVTGVSSSGIIGSVVTVAEAIVVPESIASQTFVGEVNKVNVFGVEGNPAAGQVIIAGDAIFSPPSVQSNAQVGNAIININIAAPVTGVEAAASVTTVSIAENARPTFSGVVTAGFAGAVVITTTAFDYASTANLYDKKRTIFVARRSTEQDRTIVVPFVNRVVYVDRRSTPAERIKLVA